MKQLTEIGLTYGTDKAEYHEFTEFYNEYFEKVASLTPNPKILEVGILDGGSLKMYDEFFQGKARILGVDTAEKGSLFVKHPNITSMRGDILNPDCIEKIQRFTFAEGDSSLEGFDIIIDDGGHTMEQQQKSLLNLWKFLKPGGYFIIEDLHTSALEEYNPDRTTTTLAMLKGLGEGKYYESAYIKEDVLKNLDAEMESVIVCENEFPQVRTQQPRVSITSLIVKKETEALREARLKIEAAKIPIVEHNLGDTSGTFLNTNPPKTIEEPKGPTSGTVTDENPVNTLTSDKAGDLTSKPENPVQPENVNKS